MRAELRARRDSLLGKIGSRAVIMGILNVTPDSFSDGGRFQAVDAAIAQARKIAAEGADIIDVGGESTRPGAAPVSEGDELARVTPILTKMALACEVPVSIDTYKAAVAARAVELGAVLINDVWGLQKDPSMADVVAAADALVVIMHNRADKDETVDIMSDIRRFFDRSLALAAKSGIPGKHIILDPGVGFAKTARQNRDAMAHLAELKDYGHPILIGASRKAFLGSLADGVSGSLAASVAANLVAAMNGADIFRVHDVAEHVTAFKVFREIQGTGAG